MAAKRIGGTIFVSVNGERFLAKGAFTCNPGKAKRSAVVGADGVHGYKEEHQPAMVEGEFSDDGSIDHDELLTLDNATVTVELANGRTFVLRDGWYAGDGNLQTEEGNLQAKFEGLSGEYL